MSSIKFDKRNFRKHSDKNKALIAKSLQECGAGRSILLDNDDSLIAGNGVYEQAQKLGIPVRVIETDGSELIAVKRTDIQEDDDKRKRLALADNATSDTSEWDVPALTDNFSSLDLEEWGVSFPADEGVAIDSDDYGEGFSLPDGEKAPFQQIAFNLADEQASRVREALDEAKGLDELKYLETFGNTNSNGNALYLIVSQWLEARGNYGTL